MTLLVHVHVHVWCTCVFLWKCGNVKLHTILRATTMGVDCRKKLANKAPLVYSTNYPPLLPFQLFSYALDSTSFVATTKKRQRQLYMGVATAHCYGKIAGCTLRKYIELRFGCTQIKRGLQDGFSVFKV